MREIGPFSLLCLISLTYLVHMGKAQECPPLMTKFTAVLNSVGHKDIISENKVNVTDTSEVCPAAENTKEICCQTNSLRSYFEAEAQKEKEAWKRFVDDSVNLRYNTQKMNSIFDWEKREKLSQALSGIQADNQNDGFLKGVTASNLFNSLKFIKEYKDRMKEFRQIGITCFNSTVDFKSQVICQGCDPNNDQFFDDSLSMKVKEKTCRALLGKCHSTWKFILDSYIVVNAYPTISKKEGLASEKMTYTSTSNKQFQFGPYSMGQLLGAWENCAAGFKGNDCPKESLKIICASHFNALKTSNFPDLAKSTFNFEGSSSEDSRLLAEDPPVEQHPGILEVSTDDQGVQISIVKQEIPSDKKGFEVYYIGAMFTAQLPSFLMVGLVLVSLLIN